MNTYRFGRFELQPAHRQVLVDGQPRTLRGRAFDVLLTLIERRDRLVTGQEMFEAVWPGRVVEENNLRQQIATLRKLLGPDAIATVPGKGYRFTMPLAAEDPVKSAIGPAALKTRPVIAVMPFSNLSGYQAQDYFSDAITQDIISVLSKHRWLNVLARNTTFGYKGEAPSYHDAHFDPDANEAYLHVFGVENSGDVESICWAIRNGQIPQRHGRATCLT